MAVLSISSVSRENTQETGPGCQSFRLCAVGECASAATVPRLAGAPVNVQTKKALGGGVHYEPQLKAPGLRWEYPAEDEDAAA